MRTLSLLVLLATFPLHAEQVLFTQERADIVFHTLVEAEALNDYAAFIANGTAEWKALVSKRKFNDAYQVIGPRFKNGFTIEPFGKTKQGDAYIYQIHFKDGSEDLRGTLKLESGQIASIVFN